MACEVTSQYFLQTSRGKAPVTSASPGGRFLVITDVPDRCAWLAVFLSPLTTPFAGSSLLPTLILMAVSPLEPWPSPCPILRADPAHVSNSPSVQQPPKSVSRLTRRLSHSPRFQLFQASHMRWPQTPETRADPSGVSSSSSHQLFFLSSWLCIPSSLWISYRIPAPSSPAANQLSHLVQVRVATFLTPTSFLFPALGPIPSMYNSCLAGLLLLATPCSCSPSVTFLMGRSSRLFPGARGS